MILTKKCSCGIEDPERIFNTDGTLIPNVRDKEFYGGRVNFFKEVKCDCGREYILLIEKNFSYDGGMGFNIIDMVDITDEKEYPFETLKKRQKPKEKVLEERIDTVEHTLTTVINKEVKVEKMKLLTMKELQTLCRENKLKFKVTESKLSLIDKLLEANPNLVIASEN